MWPYFRRHAVSLAVGLSALIVVDLLQLLIPRVVKHAVDGLTMQSATPASLAQAGLTVLGIAAAIGAFRYVWRLLILGFSRIVEEDLRNRIYSKLLALPPAWFMTRTTGDIMAHATNDLDAVRMAAGFGLVALVDSILLTTAAIGFMVWIDLKLTLLALIPMPLITFLTRRLSRTMHRRYRTVQDIFGVMTERVREFLSGIRVIQAHVREGLVKNELDRLGRDFVRENIRLTKTAGSFFPLMVMFTNVSMAIVIYFGGRLTIFGAISPGDFVAFISYLGLLTWPMMALGWVVNLVQRGAASLDRINSILDQQPDIGDPPSPQILDGIRGGLEIRHLTFTYPGRTEVVLEDLSLDFPAGAMTALVGRTGSGKTTVLNLIPRLFDPPPGRIFLDGIDVRGLKVADLRAAVGYVSQDGYIFSGTVAENIAFGRPDAALDAIQEAARAAALDEDVASFPDGYRTQIGERGLTLSGGQRQRLALARAFLMDPPILILDDTFSAVDAETEGRILKNLADKRAGRTTIIVAHRLTSLNRAQVIHVIEGGRLAESGRHEDLILGQGYFARLHRLQQVQAAYDRPRSGATGPEK